MKKILSTLLAFGLTAGIAATANAAHEETGKVTATGYDRAKDTPTAPGVSLFSVKGSYSLVGASQSDGLGYGGNITAAQTNVTAATTAYNAAPGAATLKALNDANAALAAAQAAAPAYNGVNMVDDDGVASQRAQTNFNTLPAAARAAQVKQYNDIVYARTGTAGTATDGTLANTTAFANAGSNHGNDAFYFHSFITDWALNIGDKISVKSQLRFADRDIWGTTGTAGTSSTGNLPDLDNSEDGGRSMDVRQIYMEYTSPIGMWRVGRVPVAAWYGNFINSGTQGNRLMYYPNFIPKPWSVLVFTQKITEQDATPGSNSPGWSDADADAYYAGVEYKADWGTTALAWWYVRDATANSATPATDSALEPLDQHDVWLFGKYNLANFTIEAEGSYDFGDNNNLPSTLTRSIEEDRDALALMLDVTGKFGPLSAGILYFYASGDDNPNDSDNQAFMQGGRMRNDGTGDDFNPYLILTGDYTGLLNQDKAVGGMNAFNSYAMDRAGVQSIAFKAAYDVTPKLALSGIIGAAWADETQVANQDDEYGIEYDLSATYKLLDNLTYGAHFGFLDSGDYFQLGFGNMDTNDITFMAHQLTMNF